MEAERCAFLISTTTVYFHIVIRRSQVSSSLAHHTQSMTAIPPMSIPTSLSSVYRFSGSAMAYRCVHYWYSRRSRSRILGYTVIKCDLPLPRNSRGTLEARLQSATTANTALRACKSKSLGAIRVACPSMHCSKG